MVKETVWIRCLILSKNSFHKNREIKNYLEVQNDSVVEHYRSRVAIDKRGAVSDCIIKNIKYVRAKDMNKKLLN